MPEIDLQGCRPEPLMGYLKALGVLRLVSEQADAGARAAWRDGVFVLHTELGAPGLVDYFLNAYQPTPIVVPWSGKDFFEVRPQGNAGPFSKTPTSSQAIEAFLATAGSRLAPYRAAIGSALASLEACGLRTKDAMKDGRAKVRFIAHLRSTAPEDVARWIDAAAVLTEDKALFSAFLGSGGGSDGNTHFSDNFMQNLWEMLPEFSSQRSAKYAFSSSLSSSLLRNALFAEFTSGLVPKRTSALYDGGAVGGQNAGQGFERVSLGNPWGFVLCIEGTLLLAGALARRQAPSSSRGATFPFLTRLSPTRVDSATDKEASGREAWLPMWSRLAALREIETLFSEGRASIGGKTAECGVDFARAATSLGVDRGIESFCRYAIVKGRVGGDNYNTSTSLGRFDVRGRADVDLIREIDPWLDRFRRAAGDDKAPPRFKSAQRRIESAIFEFCQYGGARRFGEILCALGRAEGEVARAEKFRTDKRLRPLSGLSSGWVRAAFDESVESELALSLSGIWDPKVGPLRANLEPAAAWIDGKGRPRSKWLDKERCVVWRRADLPANLFSVLRRRLMDGARKCSDGLPLSFRRAASLAAISTFIAGGTDDVRIQELLWGFALVDQRSLPGLDHWRSADAPPLPRSYALLRLLFLTHPVRAAGGDVLPLPEASVLPLLRSGGAGMARACDIALRRLRASGLVPQTTRRGRPAGPGGQWCSGGVDPERLAAALLVPIDRQDASALARMVTRRHEPTVDAVG